MKVYLILFAVINSLAAGYTPPGFEDFNQLVPVKVVQPDSKNVYEKYGIDFDGNCYTCDLAMIRLNKQYFDLVNVCDAKDVYRTEKFSYELLSNGIRIKTEKGEFVLSRIGNGPVYELKVTGGGGTLKNKKLVKYYTPKVELKKFKVHDCGEFDG
jgi:hypothetical protein